MHSSHLMILLMFHLVSLIHCRPRGPPLQLPQNQTASLRGPDLSPLIYHVPNTHNTLLIRLHDDALPHGAFSSTIREARLFIAGVMATSRFRPDSRLPPDIDPFEYPRPEALSPVSITWQSQQEGYLTWGILAAAMKGLDDCLVKNDQLPWVATWHVFDGRQKGEVGWGMVGRGDGFVRTVADSRYF